MNLIQSALTSAVREELSRTAGLLAGYIVAAVAGTLAYVSVVILGAWLVADRYGHVAGLTTAALVLTLTACGAVMYVRKSAATELPVDVVRPRPRSPARLNPGPITPAAQEGASADRVSVGVGGSINDSATALLILGVGAMVAMGPIAALGLAGRAYWAWNISRPLRSYLVSRANGNT